MDTAKDERGTGTGRGGANAGGRWEALAHAHLDDQRTVATRIGHRAAETLTLSSTPALACRPAGSHGVPEAAYPSGAPIAVAACKNLMGLANLVLVPSSALLRFPPRDRREASRPASPR